MSLWVRIHNTCASPALQVTHVHVRQTLSYLRYGSHQMQVVGIQQEVYLDCRGQ
jgi:hypothetical protein